LQRFWFARPFLLCNFCVIAAVPQAVFPPVPQRPRGDRAYQAPFARAPHSGVRIGGPSQVLRYRVLRTPYQLSVLRARRSFLTFEK
jgi:hypothetical protein